MVGLPAKVAVGLHDLAPGTASRLASWMNRVLPGADVQGTEALEGSQIRSRWAPSFLTVLGDRAARRNNEV